MPKALFVVAQGSPGSRVGEVDLKPFKGNTFEKMISFTSDLLPDPDL